MTGARFRMMCTLVVLSAAPVQSFAGNGLGGSFLPTNSSAGDKFAAVAFSSATKKYGYAFNCASRERAEQLAIEKCGASDARAVTWCKNAWMAIAKGSNNSTGWGWGKTEDEARTRAAQGCPGGGNVVVCVHARK
jgi:hypothetical protein